MKEGEIKKEVNINIEISPNILQNILDNSYKQKADNPFDYRYYKVHVLETISSKAFKDVKGNRLVKFKEYYNWSLI